MSENILEVVSIDILHLTYYQINTRLKIKTFFNFMISSKYGFNLEDRFLSIQK